MCIFCRSMFVLLSFFIWVAQWVRWLDLTPHTNLSPIRRGFAPSFVNYKTKCTRLATASDKLYQLFAQSRWFSPGTPASSNTKTGRHDIAEILLKVALNTKFKFKFIPFYFGHCVVCPISVYAITDSDYLYGFFKLILCLFYQLHQ
jgi:hypothetical protein